LSFPLLFCCFVKVNHTFKEEKRNQGLYSDHASFGECCYFLPRKVNCSFLLVLEKQMLLYYVLFKSGPVAYTVQLMKAVSRVLQSDTFLFFKEHPFSCCAFVRYLFCHVIFFLTSVTFHIWDKMKVFIKCNICIIL
jgi:hypothetical protein